METALYTGKPHTQGGIDVVVDESYNVEVEGLEYKICVGAYSSDKVLTFKQQTNKQILDYIHNNFQCEFDQHEADSGDFIICKVAVIDGKKHTRQGTVRQILNEIQAEHGCKVVDNNTGMAPVEILHDVVFTQNGIEGLDSQHETPGAAATRATELKGEKGISNVHVQQSFNPKKETGGSLQFRKKVKDIIKDIPVQKLVFRKDKWGELATVYTHGIGHPAYLGEDMMNDTDTTESFLHTVKNSSAMMVEQARKYYGDDWNKHVSTTTYRDGGNISYDAMPKTVGELRSIPEWEHKFLGFKIPDTKIMYFDTFGFKRNTPIEPFPRYPHLLLAKALGGLAGDYITKKAAQIAKLSNEQLLEYTKETSSKNEEQIIQWVVNNNNPNDEQTTASIIRYLDQRLADQYKLVSELRDKDVDISGNSDLNSERRFYIENYLILVAITERYHDWLKNKKSTDMDSWLFVGRFPNAIIYADKRFEKNGDYKEIATIYLSPLELVVHRNSVPYKDVVRMAEAKLAELKGDFSRSVISENTPDTAQSYLLRHKGYIARRDQRSQTQGVVSIFKEGTEDEPIVYSIEERGEANDNRENMHTVTDGQVREMIDKIVAKEKDKNQTISLLHRIASALRSKEAVAITTRAEKDSIFFTINGKRYVIVNDIKGDSMTLDMVEPASLYIGRFPIVTPRTFATKEEFVRYVTLYTDLWRTYPRELTDHLNIVAKVDLPGGGTNDFKIGVRPTPSKAKGYANMVWKVVHEEQAKKGVPSREPEPLEPEQITDAVLKLINDYEAGAREAEPIKPIDEEAQRKLKDKIYNAIKALNSYESFIAQTSKNPFITAKIIKKYYGYTNQKGEKEWQYVHSTGMVAHPYKTFYSINEDQERALADLESQVEKWERFNSAKEKHPDALIWVDTGTGFYETYEVDAVKTAKIIGTELREGQEQIISFPEYSLEVYLPKAVKAGNRVGLVAAESQIMISDGQGNLHPLKVGNTVGVKTRGNLTGVVTSIIGQDVYLKKFTGAMKPEELIWLTEQPSEPVDKLHGMSQIDIKYETEPEKKSASGMKFKDYWYSEAARTMHGINTPDEAEIGDAVRVESIEPLPLASNPKVLTRAYNTLGVIRKMNPADNTLEIEQLAFMKISGGTYLPLIDENDKLHTVIVPADKITWFIPGVTEEPRAPLKEMEWLKKSIAMLEDKIAAGHDAMERLKQERAAKSGSTKKLNERIKSLADDASENETTLSFLRKKIKGTSANPDPYYTEAEVEERVNQHIKDGTEFQFVELKEKGKKIGSIKDIYLARKKNNRWEIFKGKENQEGFSAALHGQAFNESPTTWNKGNQDLIDYVKLRMLPFDNEYANYLLDEIQKKHQEKHPNEEIKTGLIQQWHKVFAERDTQRANAMLEEILMSHIPKEVRASAYQAIRKKFGWSDPVGRDEQGKIVPHNDWEDNLIKARSYAIGLIEDGAPTVEQREAMHDAWTDKEKLVALIKQVLAETDAEKTTEQKNQGTALNLDLPKTIVVEQKSEGGKVVATLVPPNQSPINYNTPPSVTIIDNVQAAASYARGSLIKRSAHTGYKGMAKIASQARHNMKVAKAATPAAKQVNDNDGYIGKFFKGADYAYPNPYILNKAIEEFLDFYEKPLEQNFSAEQKLFLSLYSGMGGLEKHGASGKGLLYEYFTPDPIVRKMWALAYKFGYSEADKWLEPACGTGNFIKYAPDLSKVDAYEINKYSYLICRILFPSINITLGAFETRFIKNNNSIKGRVWANQAPQGYGLVMGNPPYGRFDGRYAGMGEKDYTKSISYVEYFITRGLDLLKPGGLLIYIIGVEVAQGGKPFLSQGWTTTKKAIAEKSDILAEGCYRLPNGVFDRTDVLSDIIVLRKKEK